MTCKGEVKSSDYCGFGANGSIGIVIKGINRVLSGKCVHRGHL